jgi:hypothetical protein
MEIWERVSGRLMAVLSVAAAAAIFAATPALAGALHSGGQKVAGTVLPATWFTDRPSPEDADPVRNPCVSATGRIDVDGSFTGSGSLVLDRREILTASHVPAVQGVAKDRFSFLLGYNRGKSVFVAEALVVARGSYLHSPLGGDHYRAGDWAIAVLDKPAPAKPLTVYRGRPEDLLDRSLSIQGYATSYAGGMVPFIARGCAVRKIDPMDGRLQNDCGADRGTSGAPLVLMEGGSCSVVGVQAGGIADIQPSPYGPRIANMATSAKKFAHTAQAVRDLLAAGLSPAEIKNSLREVAALELP